MQISSTQHHKNPEHQKVPGQKHNKHAHQITGTLTSGLHKLTPNGTTSENNKNHAKHTKPSSQSNTRKTEIR